MSEQPTAIKIIESAKNNTFVDSKVYGKVEIAGQGTKFIRTPIYTIKQEHPFLFWVGVIASFATIVTFIYWLVSVFGKL